MSNIRYEVSNTINYITPGIQPDDPANEFPHIFGNREFSFELVFTANNNVGPGFGYTPVANVGIESTPTYTIVEPLTSNSIRITKVANTSLFDESFTFINANTFQQETIDISQIIDYNTTNKLVVSWDTPPDETASSNAIEVGLFQLAIEDGINSSNTIQYSQSYYWDPDEGFDNFNIIIADLTEVP